MDGHPVRAILQAGCLLHFGQFPPQQTFVPLESAWLQWRRRELRDDVRRGDRCRILPALDNEIEAAVLIDPTAFTRANGASDNNDCLAAVPGGITQCLAHR